MAKLIKPKLPAVRRNEQGHLVDAQGQVILDKHGKPSTHWNHPRAVKVTDKDGYATRRIWNEKALSRYPVVGSDDLVRFAYGDIPVDRRLRHKKIQFALAALARIERYGYDAGDRQSGDGKPAGCLVKREGAGWRVMPPDTYGQAVARRKARDHGGRGDLVDADYEFLD